MWRISKLIKSVAGLGLATLFLLAQGCATPAKGKKSDFFISSEEIRQLMRLEDLAFPLSGSEILDDYFMCPDEEWLNGKFAKEILPVYLSERKASLWEGQSNDCDDMALHAMILMREIHYNTAYKLTATGIAFGIVTYIKAGVGPHMINWAIVRDADTKLLKLVFFEPQDSKGVVILSDNEKDSITFWLVKNEKDSIYYVDLHIPLNNELQNSSVQSVAR